MLSVQVKARLFILSLSIFLCSENHKISAQPSKPIELDFFGDQIRLAIDPHIYVAAGTSVSADNIRKFYSEISKTDYEPLIISLNNYRKDFKLDDWIYYQLIRRVAQQISPKKENYTRYTLFKWFLMLKSGYDVMLKTSEEKILFYIRSNENIYNIPYYVRNSFQYVCLNFHDYNNKIDFEKEKFSEIDISDPLAKASFSYKIHHLPDFRPSDYEEKDIRFSLNNNEYDFKVKLNPQIKTIFKNYPVVDYESYFNIPLSSETYNSLIPALRQTIKGLSVKNGVDYLMRFTRYAFLFGKDMDVFGMEKRLSPEQTLLSEQSDCEDRAALFFYLVKEIYDLPMVVLSFPEHITIAVKLDKPVGKPILYNGQVYSVCEPTPQKTDLNIGQLSPQLQKVPFEIAYAYKPLQ